MDLYKNMCTIAVNKNWTNLIDVLSPKYFYPKHKKTSVDKKILAKAAEILINPDEDIPANIRILLLKSIANSCVEGFQHKEYTISNNGDKLLQDCSYRIYNDLSCRTADIDVDAEYFPYEGVVVWCARHMVNSVENDKHHSEEQCEVLQFCVQFLVNFVTLACKVDDLSPCLKSSNFKAAIMSLMASHHLSLARATCLYIHNKLTRLSLPEGYYTEADLCSLAQPLIKADEAGIDTAGDTLLFLLMKPKWLTKTYDSLSIKYKLYLLDIIHEDVRKTVYSEAKSKTSTNFTSEIIQFLSERFRKRSDLILKTVDSYLDDMEPAEITLLLDIISVISSKDSDECHMLQSDKSLIINCIFLLKSLHMTGKASENNFTPLQKLSDVAPSTQGTGDTETGNDIQKHPAFGFKAGLIRAIGNLAHRHKVNQEVLRETDTIPLLLDCCNIDARNPLILQWTIFALRNVCENSPENQEIIRNCNKVGVVDNAVLREMGLELHEGEDGKTIGILPLPKNK